MPRRLFLAFTPQDAALADELLRHLAPLERQGLIHAWSEHLLPAGADRDAEIDRALRQADISLLLVSADFLASTETYELMTRALARQAVGEALVVPILLRPTGTESSPLASIQALPRNGKPITTWVNRDEAWLDVVRGLRNVIAHRATRSAPTGTIPFGDETPSPRSGGPPVPIGQIFTTRQPDITFVEPVQMPRLKAYLRVMGPGLVVEGPSGIGKTTAVRKALDAINGHLEKRWLSGSDDDDVRELDALLSQTLSGHIVVDDFHRLDDARKRRLADKIKSTVDKGLAAKITLIGINPVGVSLVQGFPDVAGRFDVVALGKQTDEKIAEMIVKGERAANIRFLRRDEFINAAMGSFFTAQRLCAQAAMAADVLESQPTLREIELGPLDVMKDVLDTALRIKYHDALLALATCDEVSPPRGAVLVLLWLLAQRLAQRQDGHVSIDEARYQYPHLGPAFEWLKSGNLIACFEQSPALRSLFFYNKNLGMLSVEDPQLEFYLRNMSWIDFARTTGHQGIRLDPVDGLVVSSGKPGLAAAVAAATTTTRVLHLSDLHFGTEQQARVWYDQLAGDLRQLECARLDALIVSGDIGSASTPEEYAAARLFLSLLSQEFQITARQVVLVPGNHDVNWKLSEEAYTPLRRSSFKGELHEGQFIDGGAYIEVRDEQAYRRRFAHFARFYRDITGEPYPDEYDAQLTLRHLPDRRLLLLGLNSAWQIDHHFRDRAGIHAGALSHALSEIRSQATAYAGSLRIAVWHHPLSATGDAHLTDDGLVQALVKADFRLALHGHIHRSDDATYRYDVTQEGRRIHVIGAGTSGAPVRAWLPGYPLQYNLLTLAGDVLTVEARCREELNGAWRPDARWLSTPGQDPAPRYEIRL